MYITMENIKNKNNIYITLGILLIFSGLCSYIYDYYRIKKIEVENNIKIESFFNESNIENVNNEEINNINDTYNYDNYIMILEIPSINLKRGIVGLDSYYNKINYNIEIIKPSVMPDIVNGNLILAAHNGNSNIAFFNKLDNMNVNCIINIYYKNKKYEYLYNNSYEQEKNGVVEIKREKNRNTITLITCKKSDKTKQIVYIGYLNRITDIENNQS